MKSTAELQALFQLLEDPDPEIFDAVSLRLASMGEEIIEPLEQRLERTLKPEMQQRIDHVLGRIHYEVLKANVSRWRNSGGNDLLRGAHLLSRYHQHDCPLEALDTKIERIRKDIWLEINNKLTALEKVRVINYFLFDIYKFQRSLKKTLSPQLHLIHHVLDNHQASPVMLGLIYAELARRLDLPIYGVNLPKNFVLCYYDADYLEDPNGILFYINPSDQGAVLGVRELKHFLQQLRIEEKEEFFKPCSNIDIIERLVLNLRYSYEQNGQKDKADDLKDLFEEEE